MIKQILTIALFFACLQNNVALANGHESTHENTHEAAQTQNATTKEHFELKDSWIRPANKGANTALYGVLENTDAENSLTLIGAEIVKAGHVVAQKIQIHETVFEGDVSRMIHIHNLAIPAKNSVILKPKSTHIMLLNLNDDLNLNDIVKVKLHFVEGVSKEFNVRVTPTNN